MTAMEILPCSQCGIELEEGQSGLCDACRTIDLKCPHCGNVEPETFQFTEDMPVFWTIKRDPDNGKYYSDSGSDEDPENASNPRIYCEACEKEFPLPEGFEIDWI